MSPPLDRFLKEVEHITAATFESEEERVQARHAASALLTRLRTPWENTFSYGWHAPAFLACLKICTDLKLFEYWVDSNTINVTARSADELAAAVGADPVLLKRVLGYLAAMHLLETKERDVYILTPWAASLANPVSQHTINFTFDINLTGFHNLPIFLESIKYQNPRDPTVTNFSHLFGKSLWALFQDKPLMAVDFQNAMTGYAKDKAPWTSVYPTTDLLIDLKPERALLVDVGGGHGNDITLFATAHGEQNLGKDMLVLEDLPATLAKATVPDVVRTVEYNAFEEQPVKGARAYYMHIVLHDFPDQDAVKILRRQAEAMEYGYSRLLLYEAVIGTEGKSEGQTTLVSDLTMMMVFSSSERTVETWTSLLGAAGLKIVKVYNSPMASESIIEAELI